MSPPAPGLPRVLLLLPAVHGSTGGIQRYLGDLVREIAAALADRAAVEALVLDDPAPPPADRALGVASWRGFGVMRPRARRRLAFAAAAFGAARRAPRPALVVAGHPHLAAVAVGVARLVGAAAWTLFYGIDAWVEPPPLRRFAARRADLLIAISRFTAARVVDRYRPLPGRIALLPCTADEARFTPPPAPTPGPPVVLAVARLGAGDRDKGVDTAIRAAARTRRAIPDLALHVVGDGPDRPRLEGIARDLGVLGEGVRFLGPVPDSDLPAVYRTAHAFCLPSRKEGFGIVYLEALLSGVPVVAGDRDGSREPLQDGLAGLLCDPGDPDAVAAALVRVLTRRADARILDPAGLRAAARAAFGREAFAARVRALLGSVPGLDPRKDQA